MKKNLFTISLLIATSTFIGLMSACNDSKSPKTKNSFIVRGNCEMCKERIEETALGIGGVQKAEWDVDSKKIILEFDSTKVDLKNIHTALANAGHSTALQEATDAANEALPPCCRKGADMH